MNYKILLLSLLLFMGYTLFGQSVDLQFVPSENSTETTYCINIQINGQNGADYIGISTIRFGYNPEVIRFNGNTQDVFQGSYTSLNFDSDQQDLHPECETPFGFNPYSSHGVDGLAPGDVLLTMVLLNPTPPSGAPVFACPMIEDTWVDVSEVCFEVLDPFSDPNLHFIGVEEGDSNGETTGTNFNSHFNNPNEKYLNGIFNPLNIPFADVLDDSIVVCIFENPLDLTWIQDLINNGTPCQVDHINMFEFEDDTYFEVVPNFGSEEPPCPADFPINYYDCEGTLVCAIGNFPPDQFECPEGLTDAADTNGELIFQYLAGCSDVCALNYDPLVTEDDGSCELPDCDDGCELTEDSFDNENCICFNTPLNLDDGCDLTIDSFDAANCMIFNEAPNVDDSCALTIDSFDTLNCVILNIEPDCTDSLASTFDGFDITNCECINEVLDCPTSDFIVPALESLCSGEAPTFPTDFTISDSDSTQIGEIVWYDTADPFDGLSITEEVQTQVGCEPSTITTVYAFVGCDTNLDGQIDDYVQVAQHQYQTYPEAQLPTLSAVNIATGSCCYTIEPACPTDLLSVIDFCIIPGDGAGITDVEVLSGLAGNPCLAQEFNLAYDECSIIAGCTDPCAPNYDQTANFEDGSCQPYDDTCDTDICTNGGSYVWDAIACQCALEIATVEGCTDANACNFDADANCDDGSCLENDCTGVCGGPAIAGSPCDDGDPNTTGEVWTINCDCMGGAIQGCTDPCADNYNPDAVVDDGSCLPYDDTCDTDICTNGGSYIWDGIMCSCVLETATIEGCTDATACNYNPAANCDDDSCTVDDCLGVCGGMALPGSSCDDGNPSTIGEEWTENCDCLGETLQGCTDPCAPNYNPEATEDDGSCETYNITCDSDVCTNGGTYIWDETTCSCVLETETILGCMGPTEENYNPEANCDFGLDCFIVSIESIVFEPINIFPNPARDFVTFRFKSLEESATIYFYTISGTMIKMETLDSGIQEQTFFIQDFPAGIYFWEVNGVSGKLMVK